MKIYFWRSGAWGTYIRRRTAKRILDRILNFLRILRSFVAKVSGVYLTTRSAHTGLTVRLSGLQSELDSTNLRLKETEHGKRLAEAQLMQLRVYQQEERPARMGFMVSAFIPEEVVREMRDTSPGAQSRVQRLHRRVTGQPSSGRHFSSQPGRQDASPDLRADAQDRFRFRPRSFPGLRD
jgi:hypothetical protein